MSHPEVPSTDIAIANQVKIVELLQARAIDDPVSIDIAQALNYHTSTLSLLWTMDTEESAASFYTGMN